MECLTPRRSVDIMGKTRFYRLNFLVHETVIAMPKNYTITKDNLTSDPIFKLSKEMVAEGINNVLYY